MVEEGRLIDEDLSHYEGDHLVMIPKNVSPQQVWDAFNNINKHFYSWKSILRRWQRFISTMSVKGNLFNRFLRKIILSVVLLKLSVFQRDHANHKVYGKRELLKTAS